MSLIAMQGGATGTGTVTLLAPVTNTNRTLTLPDATGTVLSSATTTGFPAGAVLQVVSAFTTTNTSTTSSSYVAVTNLTASIIPSSASSKILVLVNMNIYGTLSGTEGAMTIYRAGADLTAGAGFADAYTGSSDFIMQTPMMYLDSPSSTSSVTYAVYIKRTQGTGTLQTSLRGTTSTITLMEIAA